MRGNLKKNQMSVGSTTGGTSGTGIGGGFRHRGSGGPATMRSLSSGFAPTTASTNLPLSGNPAALLLARPSTTSSKLIVLERSGAGEQAEDELNGLAALVWWIWCRRNRSCVLASSLSMVVRWRSWRRWLTCRFDLHSSSPALACSSSNSL